MVNKLLCENQELDFRYRSDVDGLRAIAVLLVLLYHTDLGFRGGFVGVDVFFVISGFLITGLILRQQERGTFRIAEFWKRRIRRILPVSIVVVLVTLTAGYFLLLPRDLEELADSAIYQQLMMSNMYFWHHSGYFDGRAELKPLLHTWSLGVEEQFYLGYPVLLVLLQKISRGAIFLALLAIAFVSFALSDALLAEHPGATFYGLPTRAWELLIGGALAACPWTVVWSRWFAEIVSLIGLAMISYSAWVFNSKTDFPGPNALMPCLGAALVIATGATERTFVRRILSLKPVVFVGLISYSLYLWHWPLLAYQRYWFGNNIDVLSRIVILLTSFFLAVLSWRFVETPFRSSEFWTRLSGRSILTGAVFSTALILMVAVWTVRAGGFPERIPPNVLAIIEDSSRPDDLKSMDRDASACEADALPLIGKLNPQQPIAFVLWGDSHARAVAKLCDEMAQEVGIQGAVATKSGTAPLLVARHPQGSQEAMEWNDAVFRYLLRHKVPNVLIVGRWTTVAKVDSAKFSKALGNTARLLADQGMQAWFLMQIPEQPENPQRGLALAAWSGSRIPEGISREQFETHHRQAIRAFTVITPKELIDPIPYCFDVNGRSRLGSSNHSYYRDDDHLSDFGARELLQPVLQPLFTRFAGEQNGSIRSSNVKTSQLLPVFPALLGNIKW